MKLAKLAAHAMRLARLCQQVQVGGHADRLSDAGEIGSRWQARCFC
jgi:hypothetical protein